MSDKEKSREEDDEVERDPVFHYSREHRLSRASQTVRALYEEKNTRQSLAKNLFGTKSNILILMSILVICAMFVISSRISSRGSGVKLGANTLNLTLIREEGALGLGIIKTAPKSGLTRSADFYIGAVDIVVSPVIPQTREGEIPTEISQVFRHRVFFNPTDTESFFISLPFDGDDFYVFLSTEDEQKAIRVK